MKNHFRAFCFGLMLLLGVFGNSVSAQGQLQLHVNKKLFLPGEKMWFSAYLFDQIESQIKGTIFAMSRGVGQ